jgi:hypothetical protein
MELDQEAFEQQPMDVDDDGNVGNPALQEGDGMGVDLYVQRERERHLLLFTDSVQQTKLRWNSQKA